MSAHSHPRKIAAAVVVFLLSTAPAWAQDVPAGPSPNAAAASSAPTADELVHKVWTISSTVLEEHIEPPTRQEMLLGAIRGLLKAARQEAPHELSRQISALSDDDRLRSLLADAWRAAQQNGSDAAKLESAAIEGLLGAVPGEAGFLASKEFAVQQQLSENRYVGVGIALAMDRERRLPYVGQALRRGPLHRAGGQDGDRIVAVDGHRTEGLKLEAVVDLLRGAEGTAVTIELRAPNSAESRTLEIVRGVVPLDTVAGIRKVGDEWEYRVELDLPIGYVRFEGINRSTLLELRQASQRMYSQGLRALIIDLRNQSGGSVHHAAIVADALLPAGKIGRVRRIESLREYDSQPDHLFSGWPMAVLVNRGTRGEAEWLAAALQDNGRAALIGEHTSGDGYVTEMVALPDKLGAVTLRVGVLERGDGRALLSSRPVVSSLRMMAADRDGAAHNGGVVPEHSVAEFERPRREMQLAVSEQVPDQKQDQYLRQAVHLLRSALAPSDSGSN